MRKTFFLLIACMTVVACQPRINTSSDSAYKSSMASMTKDMPAEKKERLQAALISIAFGGRSLDFAGIMSGSINPDTMLVAVKEKINGKTADEIIKIGTDLTISSIDEEVKQNEVALNTLITARQRVQPIFSAVVISGAKYVLQKSDYFEEPTAEFTIVNNSALTIKSAEFDGKLTTAGREVPWVEDKFSYEFPGGLAPNESKHLELNLNMFSPWGNADFKNRNDLQLSLTLTNLIDSHGTRLIEGDSGSPATIQQTIANLQKRKSDILRTQ